MKITETIKTRLGTLEVLKVVGTQYFVRFQGSTTVFSLSFKAIQNIKI